MDDRALVAALVAGDPRGLAETYRTYADRLYTYCRSVLRDPDLAADAVHDTFIIAGERAGQLRDPDRLRSWLYAIARNECRRLLRGRARQVPLAEAGDVSAPVTDPVTGLREAELRELVWSAADGLNPGDREVFQLAVGHDLAPTELAAILGVSVAHAHARLSRARAQLERSLGALLVARTTAGECAELAALIADWDGRLTPLLRKRLGRHIDGCDICGECQRRQLQPTVLLPAYASLPMLVAPVELWRRQELTSRDPDRQPIRDGIVNRAGLFEAATGFPPPSGPRRWWRRRTAVAAAAAVLLLVVGIAAFGTTVGGLVGGGVLSGGVLGDVADEVIDATAGDAAGGASEGAAEEASAVPAPTTVPSSASTEPTLPSAPSTSASPGMPATGSPAFPTGPSPSPVPPTAPTGESPPAALSVRATAELDCSSGPVLTVTAVASEPLAAGEVFLELDRGSAVVPLTVSGREATAEAGPYRGTTVRWWVEVAVPDGRTAVSSRAEATCPVPQ